MSKNNCLLTVDGLSVNFFTNDGIAQAVQNVSFSIEKGKTFALVGESGCGKTATALSILQLLPQPAGRIVSGKITFEEKDLLCLSERGMRAVRGNKIAMIFQDSMSSLNPVYTAGEQIAEAIMAHKAKDAGHAFCDAVGLLGDVGLADAVNKAGLYPHQMSGGMLQRVMIAMAMSCQPKLLIADEPTTALDVTTQAGILDLLDQLQQQNQMSILLITHDLGIVAQRSVKAAVMYASKIVEIAGTDDLFARPLHPYTKGLLRSLPRSGFSGKRLKTISGTVPDPLHFPAGCKFHPRCSVGCDDKRCQTAEPKLQEVSSGRFVACRHWDGN